MVNAISIDVEEYFHAANLEPYVPRNQWSEMPSRLAESLSCTLEILDRRSVKGTFFVLGSLAKKYPELIRQISEQGHEVASHGLEHHIAYEQTPEQFFADVYETKELLQDITGSQVLGYRAPNFSIQDRNLWAYDKLIEAGYVYDSSLYPIWHPRYANSKKSRIPYSLNREKGDLYIVPLATHACRFFGKEIRIGIAGGAYWRIFPKAFIAWALKQAAVKENIPLTCYFHPWELDEKQPRVEGVKALTRFRHYGGIERFAAKLDFFLDAVPFQTIWDIVLEAFGTEAQELAQKRSALSQPSSFGGD